MQDKTKLSLSVTHYMWLARDKERLEAKPKQDPEAELELDWKNVFHMKTIDGIVYKSDATTGQIKEKRKP